MPQEPMCDDVSLYTYHYVSFILLLVYHSKRPLRPPPDVRPDSYFVIQAPPVSASEIVSEIRAENDFPVWLRA